MGLVPSRPLCFVVRMRALLSNQLVPVMHFVASERCPTDEEFSNVESVDDSVNSLTAPADCNWDTCLGTHGANSRPDFGFGEGGLPEGEVTYTGSSLNDGFYPSDALPSDISLERRTSDSIDGDQFRQLQQECENLRKEKFELSRALYDIERQSEVLAKQCSQILEANNEKLQTSLDAISELNGIVKYLKKESVKHSNTIAELKMEKTVLNNRLEAALSELYRKTGNTTFTMKEKLMITPRHPYGSITLTSNVHD